MCAKKFLRMCACGTRGIDVCVCCRGAHSVYSAAVWPASARIRLVYIARYRFPWRLPNCISISGVFLTTHQSSQVTDIPKTVSRLTYIAYHREVSARLIKIRCFRRMRWINFANRVCVSKRSVRAMFWSAGWKWKCRVVWTRYDSRLSWSVWN